MGPDEPLPDDVRRLLENESPAVMARELVHVRAQTTSRGEAIVRIAREAGVIPDGRNVIRLADEAVVAIQALRERAGKASKDSEAARAGAKEVWEDPAHARVETIRLRKELSEARAEVARVRALADAAEGFAARQSTLQTTIDEAHRVLDEAAVDREDDGGHVMPLWDRVADLAREADALRSERDEARATIEAVVKAVNPLRGSTPIDAEAWGVDLADPARKDLLARLVAKDLAEARAEVKAAWEANAVHDDRSAKAEALARSWSAEVERVREERDEARAEVKRLHKERDRACEDAGRADGAASVLRAGLSELTDQTLRAERRADAAEAEVKRLREQKPPAFVMRREVGGVAVEVRAPTLADLEAAVAALVGS